MVADVFDEIIFPRDTAKVCMPVCMRHRPTSGTVEERRLLNPYWSRRCCNKTLTLRLPSNTATTPTMS